MTKSLQRNYWAFAALCGWFLQSGASAELILHATFDEADIDGVTVMDRSGKGNHGEILGEDIESTSGIANEALHFPFSDFDYVDFGDDEIFDPGADSFSVSVWFDADPITPAPNKSQFVVSKGNRTSGTLGWSIWMEEGLIFARGHQDDPDTGQAAEGAYRLGMSSPEEAGTHHVVLVIDREAELFNGYLNGELMPIVGGGGAQTNELLEDSEIYSPEMLRVGVRSSEGAPLDGWVDDLQIYKGQALNETDVTFLFENPGVTLEGAEDPCDFNGDGMIDIQDLDLLVEGVKLNSADSKFDIDANGTIDATDIQLFVEAPKKLNTWVGDADLNGEFNSGDFVNLFSAAQYEDGIPMNSTWSTGDFNGDGDFDSGDFVVAFRSGGYEKGTRPAAVPEPSTTVLVLTGLLMVGCARKLSPPIR